MIKDAVQTELREAVRGRFLELDVEKAQVTQSDHFGDYMTNTALVYAPTLKMKPKEVAQEIVSALSASKNYKKYFEKLEIAGPGFINFYLKPELFSHNVADILEQGADYGKNVNMKGKRVMIEYTDPNLMKPFHIGHLMSNAIGESLSRLLETGGAEVVRVNYFSDIGLNIARAVWGMRALEESTPEESASLSQKADFLGKAYAFGVSESQDPACAEEIQEINKKIFEKSDREIMALYEKGCEWSREHLEEMYVILGTTFDRYIPESEVAYDGKDLALDLEKKGVLEESDGAIVFKGENVGLHTRVFLSSRGLPTYETKDLALNILKFEDFALDSSIIVTASEQNEYFKVVFAVLGKIAPEVAEKSRHLGHGMLRLPSGKMSSRTGDVITGESLIEEVKIRALEKMDSEKFSAEVKAQVAQEVAVSAIKYSILRQSPGKDIIFDFDKSLSFEGDSGPYLQYTYARTQSLLRKAVDEGVEADAQTHNEVAGAVERKLAEYPEITERALEESAPNYVATYLIELAREFNSYYAEKVIVDKNTPESTYRLAVASAVSTVLANGLHILGISTPERM